jgi:phosphohistidine swiveling domain-containing protein
VRAQFCEEIDTDPNPRFPVYADGNFGEVAPDRISPMSWSLIGDPVEAGVRRVLRRLLPGATWLTGSHYLFVGYYGAKPYHNISAFCHAARHVPGLAPEDVMRAYFEDGAAPKVPADPVPLHRRLAAVPAFIRELGRTRSASMDLEAEVLLLALDAKEKEPTTVARRAVSLLGEAWERHYAVTLMLVPVTTLQSDLGTWCTRHWDELGLWVNRPRELVWDTRRDGGAVPEATDFLARVGYEVADDLAPWSRYGRPSVTVDNDSSPLTDRAISEALGQPWDVLPFSRPLLLPQLSGLVRDLLQLREFTKYLAMRVLHVLRDVLPELARQRAVPGDGWPYLTIDELLAGRDLHRLVPARRAACEAALGLDMPGVVDFTTSSKPVRVAATSRPRGVSPGQVDGVVVFSDSWQEGRWRVAVDGLPPVLVCESADVNLKSLLPHASALVTARGSALSHIAILAREHGIPTVLGHPVAKELEEGQLVHVNGSSGEVNTIAPQD